MCRLILNGLLPVNVCEKQPNERDLVCRSVCKDEMAECYIEGFVWSVSFGENFQIVYG